jgi:hypothetical protein
LNDTHSQTKTICFLGKTQMRHHDYDYFAFRNFLFSNTKMSHANYLKTIGSNWINKGRKILEKKLVEWLILFQAWFVKGIFFENISRGIQFFTSFFQKRLKFYLLLLIYLHQNIISCQVVFTNTILSKFLC